MGSELIPSLHFKRIHSIFTGHAVSILVGILLSSSSIIFVKTFCAQFEEALSMMKPSSAWS